jgi:2-methylisocitrate lyase-like PEP mutase family enzyme
MSNDLVRAAGKGGSWRELLDAPDPLLLPCAHDALSARLIQQAGFRAYSIGGFPLVGARYGLPDIGLVGLGEMAAGVRDIMAASELPVMVDGDHGYGDAKNVARTIRTYEAMGASAIFIEDQVAPKRCGHMAGKAVVAAETMEEKIRAASAARTNRDTFLLARTDARAIHGLDEALRRGERYLEAGADGIFIEAPENLEEMRIVGRAFHDVPQLANMLEGGRTPLIDPKELKAMGFAMVAYPTTLIFRVARTIEKALADLAAGRLRLESEGVDFARFKEIVGFVEWVTWETIAAAASEQRKSTAA